jgi:hypothetical protein
MSDPALPVPLGTPTTPRQELPEPEPEPEPELSQSRRLRSELPGPTARALAESKPAADFTCDAVDGLLGYLEVPLSQDAVHDRECGHLFRKTRHTIHNARCAATTPSLNSCGFQLFGSARGVPLAPPATCAGDQRAIYKYNRSMETFIHSVLEDPANFSLRQNERVLSVVAYNHAVRSSAARDGYRL